MNSFFNRLLRLNESRAIILSGGGSLVSVNTDGVVVRGDAEAAAAAWEARTGLEAGLQAQWSWVSAKVGRR